VYLTLIERLDQDRKRPLTARSVLASALLGESPPLLPVRRLVRIAALFGINENQARVALSRMVARGEASSDGAGSYALAGRLLARSEGLGVARSAMTSPFDGRWHHVVVTSSGDGAGDRRARRAALRQARLGELRDGVWLRPANLDLVLADALREGVEAFTSVPSGAPVLLAATCFDLAGWARRARTLHDALAATVLDDEGALASGFERDAEVLRHLQRDPLLPAELLPRGWPGDALRASYEDFDARYRALLAASHRAASSKEHATTSQPTSD
jgi:phenylacetic acid degradation operon negative regulatory protein